MYNLYDKKNLDNKKCALKITDCIYNKKQFLKHCEGDDKKLFPQYDSKLHIIHEGNPFNFPIVSGEIIREMTDEELAITGNRNLKNGEKITDNNLVYVEAPGEDYRWHNNTWITNREYGITTGSITLAKEKEKARIQREIEFTAYHKLISNFNAKVVDLPTEEMENIILWRAEWLNVPNVYTELSLPIEETYPVLLERIKYYM